MKIRRRNWLQETSKQERERRLIALEEHIQDLEGRLTELRNDINEARERLGFGENGSGNSSPERAGDNRADYHSDKEFRGSQQDSGTS